MKKSSSQSVQYGDNLRIERLPDPATAAIEAGRFLSDICSQYAGKPMLLMLAGGSATAVLEHVNPAYLSPDITVTVTDERFSDELDVNNFAVMQSLSFYNRLIEAGSFCISTELLEGETLEQLRARFEKNIREWRSDFPKGTIVGLFGMGADGHTAGMLPGAMDDEAFLAEFNDSDRLVGALDAVAADKAEGIEYPQRISVTLPFMRDLVDHSVFYISGEKKKPALDRAAGRGSTEDKDLPPSAYIQCPAAIMRAMKDAVVFTDIEA